MSNRPIISTHPSVTGTLHNKESPNIRLPTPDCKVSPYASTGHSYNTEATLTTQPSPTTKANTTQATTVNDDMLTMLSHDSKHYLIWEAWLPHPPTTCQESMQPTTAQISFDPTLSSLHSAIKPNLGLRWLLAVLDRHRTTSWDLVALMRGWQAVHGLPPFFC